MKVPSYIPIGQEVVHRYAAKSNAVAMNAFSEVLFNMSTTAHILGGCPMGKTAAEGVVNENFKVHGYDNFYILDGSIMPCNLGVNPSLTITALSEYAMSKIKEKEGNSNVELAEQIKTAAA
jgi:cholesterol oxidase